LYFSGAGSKTSVTAEVGSDCRRPTISIIPTAVALTIAEIV